MRVANDTLISLLVTCILLLHATTSIGLLKEADYSISAPLHGSILLPCNSTVASPNDRIILLLWYKGKNTIPILSYDARNGNVSNPEQTVTRGNRIYLQMNGIKSGLQLNNIRKEDGGRYSCRVDFQKSRTRKYQVDLTVILPSENPIIYMKSGRLAGSIIGPLNANEDLSLVCIAKGGFPYPEVTWWIKRREEKEEQIDDTWIREGEGNTKNDLLYRDVSRKDYRAKFICQSSNTNLTTPQMTSVMLDMNLKPLSVNLLGLDSPLSANLSYVFTCEVTGSRPQPVITWWRDKKRLNDVIYKIHTQVSEDGNLTVSEINYRVTIYDEGKSLKCTAENLYGNGVLLQDSKPMNVFHKPLLELSLISFHEAGGIYEGQDIVFECKVKARPPVSTVSWLFQGYNMRNNKEGDAFSKNGTLRIRNISRRFSGSYQCRSTNIQGTGVSNIINITILHAPICTNRYRELDVGFREKVILKCEIEATPSVESFFWSFNNSNQVIRLPPSHYSVNGNQSKLVYTPTKKKDFGLVLCWAKNKVGMQKDPCVYRINAANPPEEPENCTVSEIENERLNFSCIPGFDGGLSQRFHIKASDEQGHLLLDITKSYPNVIIERTVIRAITFKIYALNRKGKSDLVDIIYKNVTNDADNFNERMLPLVPIITSCIGGSLILSVILTTYCLITRSKEKKLKRQKEKKAERDEEHDPDLIPKTNVSDAREDQRAYCALRRPNIEFDIRSESRDLLLDVSELEVQMGAFKYLPQESSV